MTDELARRIDQLSGVWNIVPTPFLPDEELDLRFLGTLTDFVVASGVDGMTILGVLGEGAKVTDSERSAIIDAVTRARERARAGVRHGQCRFRLSPRPSTRARRATRARTR